MSAICEICYSETVPDPDAATSPATPKPRRKYPARIQRETKYPETASANLTREQKSDLVALADEAGWSLGQTLREVAVVGMPRLRGKLRRRAAAEAAEAETR